MSEPKEANMTLVHDSVTGWLLDPSSVLHDMTLRDRFAAVALPGILARDDQLQTPEAVALLAYTMADAMLKVRMIADE